MALRRAISAGWQWRRTPEGKAFIALLGLSLLVKLMLAPFFGFYWDIQDYVNWGIIFDHHPISFYTFASATTTLDAPNYPPLMIYLCGVLTGSYFGSAHVLGIQTTSVVGQAPALTFWMKLPSILFDLGTVTVLYMLARRRFPWKSALLITASYAFSPAILCDGAFWGQTDGIPVLLLLLSLLFTLRQAGIWAGIFFALALLFKLQSVIFAPLLLLYLWRWAGWKQALQSISSMAVVVFVLCWPYLLPPEPGLLVLYRNLNAWARAGQVSNEAFNLWFLLGDSHRPAQPYFWLFSPTTLGLLLFLPILLLVLFGIVKDKSPQMLFLGAALTSVAFFVLMTLQRERYLYPSVALSLVAALYAHKNWSSYIVSSITLFLDMFIVLLIIAPSNFGLDQHFAYQWSAVIAGGAVLLSLTNIWLLGRMFTTYLLHVRHTFRAMRDDFLKGSIPEGFSP